MTSRAGSTRAGATKASSPARAGAGRKGRGGSGGLTATSSTYSGGSSSGSTVAGGEDPISPRAKEAEAAESLSSLRNVVALRGGAGFGGGSGAVAAEQPPPHHMPSMPPSMSRSPSSRDNFEPAPSLRRSGSNSGPVPMPSLSRSTSHTGVISRYTVMWMSSFRRLLIAVDEVHGLSPFPMAVDWRATVTVEERQEVRRKIRAAYLAQTRNYEDMLEVVTSVEEEFLHLCCPSRLDYIKMSVQYDKRLADKKQQLRGDVDSLTSSATSASSVGGAGEPPIGTGAEGAGRSGGGGGDVKATLQAVGRKLEEAAQRGEGEGGSQVGVKRSRDS